MRTMEATHLSTGPSWRYVCTPVASHLNHDGQANGITRVMAFPGRILHDVGTGTLRRIQFTVRTFDNSYWHSNGVSGETVFRLRSDAAAYLRIVEAKQRPGQSALIIVELADPFVRTTRGGKVHLPQMARSFRYAEPTAEIAIALAFPRCGVLRHGVFVRDLRAVVTCELCKRLGDQDG